MLLLAAGLFAVKTGIIAYTAASVVAFTMITAGGAYFYKFSGSGKKPAVFFSSLLFLAGIFLFISDNFPLMEGSDIFFPSLLFILSGSLLMVWIEEPRQRFFLWLSLFLAGVPVAYILINKGFSPAIIYISLLDILDTLTTPLLWAAGIIIVFYLIKKIRR
jgi:hypothetical protein